ncbi:MAG: hypothetical protein KF690_07435 [Bacteroidetes bacterium]|nr:hypothetical protein [Bacteroidota bacterium]
MNRLLFLLLSFLAVSVPVFAQVPVGGDGSTVRAETFFEGSISFNVQLTGPEAAQLKELNDIVQMTWHLKDDNYIIQQTPSMAALQDKERNAVFTTRLFIGDSNQVYSLDLENRRAFRKERGVNYKPERPPVVEPLGDSILVAGVVCYGYKTVKGDQTTFYYVSPKYRMNTALYRKKYQAKISYLIPGLKGCIPLKTVIKTPGYTATVTAVKIVPRKLPREEFTIPPGFTIEGYDYRR